MVAWKVKKGGKIKKIILIGFLILICFESSAFAGPTHITEEGYYGCITEDWLLDALSYCCGEDPLAFEKMMLFRCERLVKGLMVTLVGFSNNYSFPQIRVQGSIKKLYVREHWIRKIK